MGDHVQKCGEIRVYIQQLLNKYIFFIYVNNVTLD
jgi:hypothetical protein